MFFPQGFFWPTFVSNLAGSMTTKKLQEGIG